MLIVKNAGYYFERVCICGSLSLVIGRMSQLDASYATGLSLLIFGVLMLYSIIAMPAPNVDPKLKALLAFHTSQTSACTKDASDGGEGD